MKVETIVRRLRDVDNFCSLALGDVYVDDFDYLSNFIRDNTALVGSKLKKLTIRIHPDTTWHPENTTDEEKFFNLLHEIATLNPSKLETVVVGEPWNPWNPWNPFTTYPTSFLSRVCQTFVNHPSLKNLNLMCSEGECKDLEMLLQRNDCLQSLSVEVYGASAAMSLARGLNYNHHMRELHVSIKGIDDDRGTVSILESLVGNTSLRKLSVWCAHLSSDVIPAVQKVIRTSRIQDLDVLRWNCFRIWSCFFHFVETLKQNTHLLRLRNLGRNDARSHYIQSILDRNFLLSKAKHLLQGKTVCRSSALWGGVISDLSAFRGSNRRRRTDVENIRSSNNNRENAMISADAIFLVLKETMCMLNYSDKKPAVLKKEGKGKSNDL